MHLRPSRCAALIGVGVALLVSACGGATDSPQTASIEIAPPAGLANPGHLTVAVPRDLPPYAYMGKSGSEGLSVDIAQAMAVRMGLKLDIVALDPTDLPAAARSEGVDVVLGPIESSSTATPPPDLTLVPYVKDQTEFVIPQDSAYQPHQLSELCGRNVAVVAGTPQESLLDQAVRICGKAPPGAIVTNGDGAALSALRQGAAAVYLADSATAAFDEARDGDVTTTGVKIGDTQLAMGLRTGGSPLTGAITRSFYLVHSDGTYEVLLQKWGMSEQTL